MPTDVRRGPKLDEERCWRAVESRDARFDGWFIVGVTSTGIYCRPSCPAPVQPKRSNVRFFASAAAAQLAGLRSCKRCRPDASPGSPEWRARADLTGRAVRLIADGLVDRAGVAGLARSLAVSERHLHRLLVAELGAPPIALARAQRAQTARVLIETTALPFSDVAFAAGFTSVRQFNDTVRTVFDRTPTDLRRTRGAGDGRAGESGAVVLRLAVRQPFDGAGVLRFLGARAVPGIEVLDGATYRRTLRLPGGPATVSVVAGDDHVSVTLRLATVADTTAAVSRIRALLDLDADPVAIAGALRADRALARSVRKRPGLRSPGAADPSELAARAVLGQQVSVAAARTLASRLVAALGEALPEAVTLPGVTHLFPTSGALAGASDADLPMPASRRRTVRSLGAALAAGELDLGPAADRADARRRMLAIPGIGPWTADYVAMRAFGDPDAFLPTDLGVLTGARALGLPDRPAELARRAERWRPWRAYAVHHLWSA